MTFWFLILGIPLAALGAAGLVKPAPMRRAMAAFPRSTVAGWVLCALAWAWTAYECHIIGIDVFDKYLKAFPGELPLLAVVLTVLTCAWMPNLLPLRALSGILMLFPGQLFPAIRLCDTGWRLTLVVFAYFCAMLGMWAMFYPWHLKRLVFWIAEAEGRFKMLALAFAAIGGMFTVLGALSGCGVLS